MPPTRTEEGTEFGRTPPRSPTGSVGGAHGNPRPDRAEGPDSRLSDFLGTLRLRRTRETHSSTQEGAPPSLRWYSEPVKTLDVQRISNQQNSEKKESCRKTSRCFRYLKTGSF